MILALLATYTMATHAMPVAITPNLSTTYVSMWNDRTGVHTAVVATPAVMLPMLVAPNHNYQWCRDSISQYQVAEEEYMASVLGFAALTLTGVGAIESMLAAGTFQAFANGLGYGTAAGTVVYLYERTLIDDTLMREACG